MAKYSFFNTNSSQAKVPHTLGSCSEGDIISLPTEGIDLAIITNEVCHHGYISIISLDNGAVLELSSSTPCRRYIGILQVDAGLFEDFI
jgi:hypothetical protein